MERSEKEDSKGNGIPDALGMRSRNVPWIDAWKGWLILLVVVGHAAGAVCHMVEGVDRQVCRGVYFFTPITCRRSSLSPGGFGGRWALPISLGSGRGGC